MSSRKASREERAVQATNKTDKTGQDRTGQDRTGQDTTKQDTTSDEPISTAIASVISTVILTVISTVIAAVIAAVIAVSSPTTVVIVFRPCKKQADTEEHPQLRGWEELGGENKESG